jgi:hypothetical protein
VNLSDVPMTLLTSGCTAETPLSLQGFSVPPTEARISAQGMIRLWDGREYTDPSKAAEAIFDPWFFWTAPGGDTLGNLRQRAREGGIGNQIPPDQAGHARCTRPTRRQGRRRTP